MFYKKIIVLLLCLAVSSCFPTSENSTKELINDCKSGYGTPKYLNCAQTLTTILQTDLYKSASESIRKSKADPKNTEKYSQEFVNEKPFCPDHNIGLEEMIRAFVQYSDSHPELADTAANKTFKLALKEAFPCSKPE